MERRTLGPPLGPRYQQYHGLSREKPVLYSVGSS